MQHSGIPVHSSLLCRLFLPQQVFFWSYCRQSCCTTHGKSHMREAYHLSCAGNTSYHGSPRAIFQFLHNWLQQGGILEGLLSLQVLLGAVSLLGMVEVLIKQICIFKTQMPPHSHAIHVHSFLACFDENNIAVSLLTKMGNCYCIVFAIFVHEWYMSNSYIRKWELLIMFDKSCILCWVYSWAFPMWLNIYCNYKSLCRALYVCLSCFCFLRGFSFGDYIVPNLSC